MNGAPNRNRERPSIEEMFETLEREELVGSEERRSVEQSAADLASGISRDPWYIQGLAGAGAWLSAALVVASLGCSGLIELSGIYPFVWGPLFVATGTALHLLRGSSEPFSHQLALATALIGEGLLAAGLYEQQGLVQTTLVYGGLAAVLYPLYTADSHRFISTFGALSLAAGVVNEYGGAQLYGAVYAFETAALCVTFSETRWIPTRFKLALRPLGYAAAVSLLWLSSELFVRSFVGLPTTWPYAAIGGVGLVYLVAQVANRISETPWTALVLATPGIAGLAAASTPAVVVACMVLLIGISRRALALLVLGAAVLIYNLGVFYYAIDLSVQAKAAALVGSGAMLLALRWGFQRRVEKRTEGET